MAAVLPIVVKHLKDMMAKKRTKLVLACNFLVNSVANFDLSEKARLKLTSIMEKKLSSAVAAQKAKTFGTNLVTSRCLTRFRQ